MLRSSIQLRWSGTRFAGLRAGVGRVWVQRRRSCAGVAGHLQNYLLLVTKVNLGELGVLLTPFCDVRFVALEPLEKMVRTKMRHDVCSLFRHEYAGVFRIGEV